MIVGQELHKSGVFNIKPQGTLEGAIFGHLPRSTHTHTHLLFLLGLNLS